MPKDPVFHRKLAAILAADVVGYSRLMEADEVGTLKQVQSVQKTCMTPITEAYGGRLIKTTGDGFLFEFSSAVEAIYFALAFQNNVQAAMAPIPEAKRLVFRVGVHAGDVLSDGADMFGDGVNVAARLETLCVPGGICMSAVVQQQLHGKIDLPLVDLGAHRVKNITRAVHVFGMEGAAIGQVDPAAFKAEATSPRRTRPHLMVAFGLAAVIAAGSYFVVRHAAPASKPTEAAQPQSFSLAVLPFKSLNTDAKPDDFADALVDNITTAISIGLPTSTVISSASAFTYRGKNIDPRQVGRELGATYLLEGSVQKFSDRLRVNVQLIEAASAAELWSDQFDGPRSDITLLQDQITAGIANTLQVELNRIEANRRKDTINVSSLDLLLRGETILYREFSGANFDKAEADFRQALVLDPNNLTAMIELGNLLQIRVSTAGGNLAAAQPKAMLAEAQDLLERARAQDSRHPGLHNALGWVDMIRGQAAGAAQQFRTEIEIDRNAATAYEGLAGALVLLGRSSEAIPLIEKSIRLDPRNPHIGYRYFDLMQAYFVMEKYPEAIAAGEKAYGDDPNDARLLYIIASSTALQGDLDTAKVKLAEAQRLQAGGLTVHDCRLQRVSQDPIVVAITNRFCDGLKRAGLPE